MENITIQLDVFEGPFDLLFHLIEKNEIDIYDIPIAQLTEQYISFLEQAEYKNMDNMSEFLVMAATLIEIKSKMLLPKQNQQNQQNEQNKDPREELVNKLLEYKKFKEITEDFKKREQKAALILYKQADKAIEQLKQNTEDLDKFLNGITLDNLYKAFKDVMKRQQTKVDRVRSTFKSVERDLYTIDEKINYIRDLLILRPCVSFHTIFREKAVKMEIVVTFLALLELIKMKEVSVSQKGTFSEIIIKKLEVITNEINGA